MAGSGREDCHENHHHRCRDAAARAGCRNDRPGGALRDGSRHGEPALAARARARRQSDAALSRDDPGRRHRHGARRDPARRPAVPADPARGREAGPLHPDVGRVRAQLEHRCRVRSRADECRVARLCGDASQPARLRRFGRGSDAVQPVRPGRRRHDRMDGEAELVRRRRRHGRPVAARHRAVADRERGAPAPQGHRAPGRLRRLLRPALVSRRHDAGPRPRGPQAVARRRPRISLRAGASRPRRVVARPHDARRRREGDRGARRGGLHLGRARRLHNPGQPPRLRGIRGPRRRAQAPAARPPTRTAGRSTSCRNCRSSGWITG